MSLTVDARKPRTGAAVPAEQTAERLSHALARVAADRDLARHLHEILGGYCHQCRNLLNTLNISLYLARRSGAETCPAVWCELERGYREVEQFVERLQSVCRPVPLGRVRLSLGLLIEGREAAWSEALAESGRGLVVDPPIEPAVGQFDPVRVESAFNDLVAWRARAGESSTDLRVRWSADRGWFSVVWDEPLSTRSRRARPGKRGPTAATSPSAPGCLEALTIPSLARVASLHGGTLEGPQSDPWKITLRWPLDPPA